jgi:hypothetical protein
MGGHSRVIYQPPLGANMNRRITFFAAGILCLIGVSAVLLQGCGAAGSSIGYANNVTYGGSGSAYTAQLNNNLTFTITKKASTSATTVDLTVTGTYTRLTSGILELTVSTSSDTTNGPSAGAKAYALDIPGTVLLLKPMGSTGGEIIPMVATGTCPTSDYSGNWVTMQDSNTSGNYSTQGLAGTFSYTATTSTGSVGATTYLSSGSSSVGSAQSLGALTCSAGVGTFPTMNGDIPEMYFTSGGGAIVRVKQAGGQTQGIAMVSSAALTLSNFSGTYVGLVFDEGETSNGATGGSTQPISVTLNSAGTGTGALITDVTTNTLSTTQTATITLSQLSPSVNGLMKMTINGGSLQNTVCAAVERMGGSNQNGLFCAGPSNSGTNKLFSYLLVTKRT